MLMVMYMKGTGKTIKHMGLVDIFIQTEPLMKEIGKKTNNMEKEKKHGLMGHATKVIM